ncbi:ribosome maturation factor RimM [Tunturibacter empetritectus]|uniref:Ribosome maturation factor RimM n=1 Tax=Tunturiibacter lichenicola TaxID=2051959 RepID=A0A7W8JA03_9BACT|nr:ribosome maturation factor RimM [Edaphobacter lichenicola]MBB5344069.1 16S rRNA processing protein RimM [Edaphobacter lichenicola]
MTQTTPAWIVLAHLLRPQGRKGEVLAELLTDFPERFEEQRRVFLAASGFAGEESGARAMEVVAFWLPVGKNEGRIVLQFAGIDTISDAETVAGLDVIVPREERRPLDDDSVYISELIGCTVYDGATAVGVVEDVQFATTADGARRLTDAAPLLEITSLAGDEILIPFVKAFLVAVDTAAKRIEMKLPEGLIEVNRSSGDKS